MGSVCAIRAHTQEPFTNEKTFKILLAAFACEGNCRKSRRLLFLFLTSSGGSAKRLLRLKAVLLNFLVPAAWHLSGNIFCSTEDIRAVTFS